MTNMYIDKKPVKFFSSGCTILDCMLGGGWAERRISNIVGNSGSGKTMLAEEAAINFKLKYSDGEIWYHETESAFDYEYAESIGLDTENIKFIYGKEGETADTVESFHRSLQAAHAHSVKNDVPILYILDSLDALTDEAEKARDIGEGSYGTGKAKQLSSMFRQTSSAMCTANVTLMIISQLRDNIGAAFGNKWTVSGGKALGFYCSQRIRLVETGKIDKTHRGIKRPIGIHVKTKCFKNKVGKPFRECEFDIKFYYGIDNLGACMDWLASLKNAPEVMEELGIDIESATGPKKKISGIKLTNFINKVYADKDKVTYDKIVAKTIEVWDEIEVEFEPVASKYSLFD